MASHEERRIRVLLSRSSVATPALFRFANTRRRPDVLLNATSCIPDNGGCSQATAWMLRLIGSSPGRRAFPPFFLSSTKGDRPRRRRRRRTTLRRRPSPPVKEGKKSTAPHPPVETTDTRTQPHAYAHAHASDRTCIRECSALSLRFIIGNRPDITARTLLIGRRDANRPTPLIPIHPRKNCIGWYVWQGECESVAHHTKFLLSSY